MGGEAEGGSAVCYILNKISDFLDDTTSKINHFL